MRVRILPLPEITAGGFTVTPFVLVVDRVSAKSPLELDEARQAWEEAKEQVGACLVLVAPGDIELDESAIQADPAVIDRLAALAGA